MAGRPARRYDGGMRVPLLLLALVLAAPAARAAVVVRLSVKDMAGLADLVVRGRVEAKEARWEGGRIFTFVRLTATSVWKGRVKPGQPVTVAIPGGEVGDLGQLVSGTPHAEVGDDVVLFLEARPVGWVVVGLGLGWLRAEPDEAGRVWVARETDGDLGPGLRMTLEALERRAALGRYR